MEGSLTTNINILSSPTPVVPTAERQVINDVDDSVLRSPPTGDCCHTRGPGEVSNLLMRMATVIDVTFRRVIQQFEV